MSTTEAGRHHLLAHLAMLTFSLLIAGSFALGSLIVGEIAPAPLNAVRFLLGTTIMGVAAFGLARHRLAVPAAPWRFAILGALMAVYFVTMFIALKITAPVATSAVFTLIPLLVAGFGLIIVGQRTGPVGLLSLVFAGLGSLWVIFRGDIGAIGRFEIGRGEQIFFVGCVCYAINTPLLRRFSRGEPAMVLSFFSLAASTVWIGLYGLPDALQTDWGALSPLVWWVIIYLAIFPTAVSFFLLQFASLHLPAAKVIAYGYLTPIFVILLEGLMGHGWASLSVLAGALVTVFGLAVLGLVPERRRNTPNPHDGAMP
ncbi:DMT family transporter [Devosia rhodophyticola]|uniref:DMT family transporter n=1 Tax=Devosia rhodophyticola TaxID=3026423 RepID=A0ABY7Z1L5_9HYPH|nr:DMT family transporter [Devosia rhodophyticola]WDR07183.1 DMT family transporter [Devosia rhodophyticola]